MGCCLRPSETIPELTRDVKHLGADIGLVCVLHTWGQNLKEHPHLHCIRNFRHPNCPKCKKGRLRFAGLVKDVPWEPG